MKRVIADIRKLLLESESVTKVDLNERLDVSFPTISKLIVQMEKTGEIVSTGLDESSGGRRAKRYTYNRDFKLGLAVFLERTETCYTVFNLAGEVKEEGHNQSFLLDEGIELLAQFIEKMIGKHPGISAVSIGVPGAVDQGRIIHIPGYDQFQGINLTADFEQRFSLPVVVENDMNAAVIGYQNEKSGQSVVYLYTGQNGPGAGVLINGNVIRGSTYFAGEIQYVPQNHKENFGYVLQNGTKTGRIQITTNEQIEGVSRLIAACTAIINPDTVVFSRDDIEQQVLDQVGKVTARFIPPHHLPTLAISQWKQDYLSGLQKLGLDCLLHSSGGN